jgi:hypothetical protein
VCAHPQKDLLTARRSDLAKVGVTVRIVGAGIEAVGRLVAGRKAPTMSRLRPIGAGEIVSD